MKFKNLFATGIALCFFLPLTAAHVSEILMSNRTSWGFDLDGMDLAIKPGNNFYDFVNGTWARHTTIPGEKKWYGTFVALHEQSEARVREIIEAIAKSSDLTPNSDEAKLAAIYHSFLDVEAVEELDSTPLLPYLSAIRFAESHGDLARIMGRAPSGFGSSFFAPSVATDLKKPSEYTLTLAQSGLGLFDREYYVAKQHEEIISRYQEYVRDILMLIDWEDPGAFAEAIVAMETKIAHAHWTRAASRDREKTYNKMAMQELPDFAPGFPWALYFEAAQVSHAKEIVLRQNTAFPALAAIFAETDLKTLQAWLAFHCADEMAPLLSKRFVDTHFLFRGNFLNGIPEQRPRWKAAVQMVEDLMGEAIGRTYVERYFPPESKIQMEELVRTMIEAFSARIEQLSWMSAETKENAQKKLALFNVKIGYPSKWRDYSALEIRPGQVVENKARFGAMDWERDFLRIGMPVDRDEWAMTPQTVNAYYMASRNEIAFPAAILQPPFFDPNADAAVNYGAIGSIIAHEITHGFDDQGRKTDGNGFLTNWWTDQDGEEFQNRASGLGRQYEAIPLPLVPDAHLNGTLTMGENIGDLGGVLISFDGYQRSLKGNTAEVLDGFTGEQRFFLGWAQAWRFLIRPDALKQLIINDPHSPGDIRAWATLRNVDAWYEAFNVTEEDAHYLRPEDRVRIW